MHSAPSGTLRLAVLQRVCPSYRIALFTLLASVPGLDLRVFVGEDLPNSKVKNAYGLDQPWLTRLKTAFITFAGRTFPLHKGLGDALRDFRPDVILCEGESHFLGYLQAMYYRRRHDPKVALMHWCFITLPGRSNHRTDFAGVIKGLLRRHFDAFVVYSSFSRDCLIELGEPSQKIFVATNVGEVSRYSRIADTLTDNKTELRHRLHLPNRFTVLYVGSLDLNKRPDTMVELAATWRNEACNFVILGDGPLLEPLRARVVSERLENVFVVGKVTDDLTTFYKAADVLVVPGRGGIIMSEAMATGLPVIVHQGDGTEFDLVRPGETGYRLFDGSLQDFSSAIARIQSDPLLPVNMSKNCRELMRSTFTEIKMVDSIIDAAHYAATARWSRTRTRGGQRATAA